MSDKDKYKNIPPIYDESDDEGESGGSQGSSGIEFKDFAGSNQFIREDLLSPEERKRLLIVHGQTNEASVKNQKARRDEYKALKEGKKSLEDFRRGKGAGMDGYKTHFLSKLAQFSGMDAKVNPVTNEHMSETNNDKKEELVYQYQLQNRPQYANAPRVAPKPSPFGKSS